MHEGQERLINLTKLLEFLVFIKALCIPEPWSQILPIFLRNIQFIKKIYFLTWRSVIQSQNLGKAVIIWICCSENRVTTVHLKKIIRSINVRDHPHLSVHWSHFYVWLICHPLLGGAFTNYVKDMVFMCFFSTYLRRFKLNMSMRGKRWLVVW